MGVGKTHILQRYTTGKVPEISPPTIGMEFALIIVPLRNNKRAVRAQLWDTAGQEKYRSMVKFHYQRAHGAILVYDVTTRASFQHCEEYWLPQFRECCQEDSCIILLGNQVDKSEEDEREREVSTEEAKAFADS